ncbi:hypothetical protein PB1_02335 [Bacillus methanolicus PB1]|uniref:Lipoprotein n=1 Tax=Bacillus methanolicus PB1 TaxID=997296 RepID=I3E5G9_BACMT|nr:hypothetical protein [Bacillus methanolicus]EIJ81740.1 hypothetical protein PB1_02335 [Bacillus methanolicus PB1]
MKNFKQWLLALMAVFMVAGFATGCTNDNEDQETDDTTTEENQDAGNTESTEESGQ